MTLQAGDILLYQTIEGIDIDLDGGFVNMTRGLETLVVLSLLGGNVDDDYDASTEDKQWWGNVGLSEARRYRSKFLSTVAGKPITSALLVDLRDAALEDLNRDIVSQGLAESVGVEVRLTAPKSIALRIELLLSADNIAILNVEVPV